MNEGGWVFAGIVCIACVIGGAMFGIPQYGVYSSRLAGEAELSHAEYSKKVAVETAKAKKDSAQLEADAEVIRAEGVAKANKIIGDSLKGHSTYLQYLWITSMDHSANKTVVYVPTEAGLPILESQRLAEASKPAN